MMTHADEALGDAAFATLLAKIERERGFGCGSYKERCLRRRVAVRMRARGVHDYVAYGQLLDRDAHEYERLLDALTINVTKLFRNPDTWRVVGDQVIPCLWDAEGTPIRVWSAGCASGEEPYTLALLFRRHAEGRDAAAALGRVGILGTDIDRASLATAERGHYAKADLADVPAHFRERELAGAPPFDVPPDVRALVRFARHDLLSDPTPRGPWQLIVCRNVLIYFDRDTQDRIFERFHAALAPGGFLVLGKVETLLGPARSRFTPIDSRERIFRRR